MWVEFALLFRLYVVYSIFKGENPTYVILLGKKTTFNIDLYSDIYRLISFKLGMVIETTKFYILKSVWMTLTLIQGHSCMRNQNCDGHFLANLGMDLD